MVFSTIKRSMANLFSPKTTVNYHMLPENDQNTALHETAGYHNTTAYQQIRVVYFVLGIWSFILTVLTIRQFLPETGSYESIAIYSPLQDSIEYERIVFNQGLWGEKTEFMGTPNSKSIQAWEDLLQYGIIHLKEDEASKLYNTTMRDPAEPQYYVAAVEMWHQLHCLKMIWEEIWSEERYVYHNKDAPGMQDLRAIHIDHCIDYLRQIIICHGDTGIIPFHARDEGEYIPTFNITRKCRKYEPLMEWAKDHKAGNNTPDGSPPPQHGGHGH